MNLNFLILILKLMAMIAVPINILLRQKIAIDKFGLDQYKKMKATDLFEKVSWRDSTSKSFGVYLLLLDVLILLGVIVVVANFIIKIIGN